MSHHSRGQDQCLLSCVVQGQMSGVKEKSSACGLILNPDEGVIITHGALLTELCLQDPEFRQKISNGDFIASKQLESSVISILFNNRWSLKNYDRILNSVQALDTSHRESVGKNSKFDNRFTKAQGQFLGAFRNNYFYETLCTLMPDSNWSFGDPAGNDSRHVESGGPKEGSSSSTTTTPRDDEAAVVFQLMSYFVILRIQPLVLRSDQRETTALTDLLLDKSGCCVGDVAELVSTPFGALSPAVFFNSYSQGVVSNISGVNDCWILTDARCIPGSEGAPLVTSPDGNSSRQVSGLVAASLCWKGGEWVGFSVACSLHSIRLTMAQLCGGTKQEAVMVGVVPDVVHKEGLPLSRQQQDHQRRDGVSAPRDRLLSSTVLIQVGSTWGSGVIVDKGQGLILTCSHVVKDADVHSVHVIITSKRSASGDHVVEHRSHRAQVVYRQSGETLVPLDVAVLSCPDAAADAAGCGDLAVPTAVSPRVGDSVYAVGHAVFGRQSNLRPSVSRGVVSKVIKFQGRDIMVQSTCAVHPGASGGPLLSADGRLLGVLVCNTRDHTSGTSFPHINMSVPALPVMTALQHASHTGDISYLRNLQLNTPYVKQLWALGSPAAETTAGPSKL